jgi:hypothetical protein
MHIVKITCVMLNKKNLPDYSWVEAITTTMYITNRIPIITIHGMTPKEKFAWKKLNVSNLIMFSCLAYVYVFNCCNPNLGFVTKAKVCKGAGQEGSLGVTSHVPGSEGECEGMNPHTPK